MKNKSKLLLVLLTLSTLVGGTGRADEVALKTGALAACESTVPRPHFIVCENDIWVQVGDSITEQKLYTTYLEAFTRARYPKLPFVAVNSGKSGEVYIQGLIRFKPTVAAYHPTLVTVNFGMNDHVKVFAGGDFQDDPANAPQRFMRAVADLKTARLYVLTASPLIAPEDFGPSVESLLNPNKTNQKRDRSNPVNQLFADKLKIVAARNHLPVLDQMTPLQQIWGANYPRDAVASVRKNIAPILETPITGENVKNQANAIRLALRVISSHHLPVPDRDTLLAQGPGQTASPAEWEAFRLYLQKWAMQIDESDPPFVRVSGFTGSSRASDLIHPNEAGHLHMAGVLFKLMKADGLVSAVDLDAPSAKVVKAVKAVVRDVSFHNGVLSFKRWDESLPLPIDPLARPGLGVDVNTALGTPKDLFGLSRYLISVAGLPKGTYRLAIDGDEVARVSADELAKGVDLGLSDRGPVAAQCAKVWETVRANVKSALATKTVPATRPPVEPILLAEAQPVEHVWTITPVTPGCR